ncbi:NAD-dependent epimerase/dehydratase family protein [Acinetobacter sp. F9]
MRVYLVTGAAGFIGSHICEELLKEPNNYVVGIDNFTQVNQKILSF